MTDQSANKDTSKLDKRPHRPLRQAERVAISDARMFDAAIRLIGTRGTHNTTLKDVGEEAGYSRGLASHRFGSKEALFGELISHFNTKWKSELGRFVGQRTGLAAFIASLDAVEHFLLNEPAYMKAMYILWYESISSYEDVRERLAKYHDVYRRDAAGWIEQGKRDGDIRPDIESGTFAVIYWSFLSGTIYQWLVKSEAINVHETFKEFKRYACEVMTRADAP